MKQNDFDFESVFIDNDKPEMVFDTTKRPVPPPSKPAKSPRQYDRRQTVINKPYSDKPIPGPYVPDYDLSIDTSAPNPVPNTYLAPGHRHCCPDRNIIPMKEEDDECGCYVTRHELNKVLANIARADIFKDLSENGTTTSVGGIKKGTKFDKLTFSKLVKLMLYPEVNTEDDVYACKSPDGKRTILNSTVKYPIGDLKEGDSLEGMTVSQIIEAMICGTNKWGTYLWKTDLITVAAGTTTIDAEEIIPKLVEDYDVKHKYEMLVVCKSEDKENEETYKYDEIIAKRHDSHQKTNVSIEGVPSDIKWSYNPESKKITLHTDTETTVDIAIVLVRR
jgi:hypothetical protein